MDVKSALFLMFFFLSSSGFAAISVNAACELEPNKPMEGTNANKGFVIASLSKIFTTYWALEKRGPFFQYETIVHIETLSPTVSNIHISGGADPTWGREMLHYLASELDRLGVRKIEKLTFDENFLLSWRAQAKEIDKVTYYFDFTDLAGAESVFPTTSDIQKSLLRHFKPRTSEYQTSLLKANLSQVAMVEKLSISAPKKVEFLANEQFKAKSTFQILRLRSLPLYKILK
ncbi:MAG: D-alanyl-D-alanine carboxypeptidase, partial [Bdellovibrionaceae bacterium]|nr:D-alanyl-D-alanine carboxypeptidase [Pseudobdellovibrionaceae bacterium]